MASSSEVRDGFARCRRALRDGRPDDALAGLRALLAQGDLAHLEATGAPVPRVLLAGRLTTTWLAPVLTAAGWADGMAIEAREGSYDAVLQSLETAAAGDDQPPTIVVLLPWHHDLLAAGDRGADDRVDDELDLWRRAWTKAHDLGARVVQVGYDWVVPGPAGFSLSGAADAAEPVALVRRLNEVLRTELTRALPNQACFVDLPLVAGDMGRARFYDPRRFVWTKQPFSEAGTVHLAHHLWAALRSLISGPKKVLVLDLDNTLWGGVVGELGGTGVALGDSPEGEAFRGFQAHCKALSARGVVLAVASKNNPADARAPFELHPDMVLVRDDFAAFEAGWEAKDRMLRRIAEKLRLGLDSFVFFDDNPAEREQIRQALPEVTVVEVPVEPAEYVRALSASLAFESSAVTDEDRARAADYRADHARQTLRAAITADADPDDSLIGYLRSLAMVGDLRPIDDTDLPRVLQLLGKTNQWNLTTRRHGEARVRDLLARPGSIGLTLRLEDRFGPSGLVAVLIAVPDDDRTLRIDSWLMSCRVIGRTAEHFVFAELVARARALGYERLLGEHIETPKNAPVAGLFEAIGFEPLPGETTTPGQHRFVLALANAVPPATAVRRRDAGATGPAR